MTPFEERMAALQAKFREEAAEVRDRLRDCEGEELEAIAHRFSGMAGMFGFPAISAAGHALENALRDGAEPSEVAALKAALIAELDAI